MNYIKDLDFMTDLSEVESQIEGAYQRYNNYSPYYRPTQQKGFGTAASSADNGGVAISNVYITNNITNVYYLGGHGGHGGYGGHRGYGRQGDDDDYDDD